MADGYWRYADGQAQAALHAHPAAPVKRPRSDYPDIAGAPEYSGYLPRDEEKRGHRVIRDTESIGASYDQYLRSGISSFGGGESGRSLNGGMSGHLVEDPRLMAAGGVDGRTVVFGGGNVDNRNMGYGGGSVDSRNMGFGGGSVDSRSIGFGGGRTEIPLPPDASNTLFVEGLPANCTRREVSHIFRPFVGFQEVRLVSKESRNPGGDPIMLCFVDFSTPSQAAVALDALQGYKFDEHDRESANLRLQFARFPGPRSAGGPRGRR